MGRGDRTDVVPAHASSEERTEASTAMLASMEVGDTALTTSGLYGVIIDITDDDVIVEFGNNKNCRIPMQKAAIAQIEKPGAENIEAVIEQKPGEILSFRRIFPVLLYPNFRVPSIFCPVLLETRIEMRYD